MFNLFNCHITPKSDLNHVDCSQCFGNRKTLSGLSWTSASHIFFNRFSVRAFR
jgi:hypothetical protein